MSDKIHGSCSLPVEPGPDLNYKYGISIQQYVVKYRKLLPIVTLSNEENTLVGLKKCLRIE